MTLMTSQLGRFQISFKLCFRRLENQNKLGRLALRYHSEAGCFYSKVTSYTCNYQRHLNLCPLNVNMVQCNLSTFRAWLNYTGRWLGNKMWGFVLKYHIQTSWVFSQWANQSETACLPNSLHLFFCQLIQCTSALLWQSFSALSLLLCP